MPNVTATPKGQLNGEVVTEFTDATSTASVTYTYPLLQSGIMVENSGETDIYVTVGTYANQVIKPNKKWKADVSFTSFFIRSDINSQEFTATAYQNDVEGSGIADHVGRMIAQAEFEKRGANPQKRGAKGDGLTDDTLAVQETIDAGNTLYLPDGLTFVVSGLLIDGKPTFSILGNGKLKLKSGSTKQLIKINNSSNIYIPLLNLDGNVAQNGVTINQFLHTLAIYTSSKVYIGTVISSNPPGDAVYLNDVNDCQIDTIWAYADIYSGRNALSIIKGQRIQVGRVTSYRIGYPGMPSGIDIEPNFATDTITDVTIGELICDSVGTAGFSIVNVKGATVERVSINSVYLTKNSQTDDGCQIFGAKNVNVGFLFVKNLFASPNAGAGLYIDNCSGVDVDMDIENVYVGIRLGFNTNVDNFTLRGRIRSTINHNIQITRATNGEIDMNLKNPGNGFIVVTKASDNPCTNIRFKGDYSKGTTGSACFLTNAAAGISGWILDGIDFTGWAANDRLRGTLFQGNVKKINCPNLNYGTAAPNFDHWTAGDIIENTAPTLVKNISHWRCIANGSPGTWAAYGSGTGTTAQRPTLVANDAGYSYFDTTLAKMILWNGTAWVV